MADSKVLLHCDGSAGSTALVDSSGNGYACTISGSNTSITSSTPKFGSGALRFAGGGGGDYATIDPAASNIPSGDFCIDFWFRTSQGGRAYAAFMSRSVGNFNAGAWLIAASNGGGNGQPEIYWADYNTGSPFMTSSNAGYNDGAWHHFAWTRSGDVHRMFVDGVQVATRTTAAQFTGSSSGITLGNDLVFGPRGYVGDLDEIHLVYGSALYTSNFTPPTAPYADGGTSDVSAAVSSSQAQSTYANNIVNLSASSSQAQSTSAAINMFMLSASSSQAQKAAAKATMGWSATVVGSQASQSSSVGIFVGFLMAVGSNQGGQSSAAAAASRTVLQSSSSQAQSSAVAARIAPPVSAAIATSQAQSNSMRLVPQINLSISSSQGSQSTGIVGQLAYVDPGAPRNKKTTATMDWVSTKWIVPKRKKRSS